jgi:hypothetical protein
MSLVSSAPVGGPSAATGWTVQYSASATAAGGDITAYAICTP